MGNDWPTYPLEECMDAIIDYRGKTPRKTISGIPLITAKIIKNGGILPVQEYIAFDEYNSWMKRGIPKKGDVLLTTEAPLGEVAQLDGRKVALAQRLITLRGKSGFLDNTFLKYQLQHYEIQHQLSGRASGTTVSGIKQSELRKVKLSVPIFSEQRIIAHILGSLDDKIELNRKMNETLEAMAQTLFKSWFVDFDPVIDNALAAGNDIPEELKEKAAARKALGNALKALPEKIRDLFPSEFEWTDGMGWIPEGWKIRTVGDIGTNHKQSIKPRDLKQGTPYIGLEHMPRKCIALSEWEPVEKVNSNKSVFKKGQILFGKLRPYFHKVGVTSVDGVCSTDILVIEPKAPEWFGLILAILSSNEFVEFTSAASTGTKMPRTNWKDMAGYSLILPPKNLGIMYNRHILPKIHKIQSNTHQSRSLAITRNTLLPKLLSGELRIPDAEKMVKG